jgi:biopolymer transport protein ExbD
LYNAHYSGLEAQSNLKPSRKRGLKKVLAMSLTLTSLVDAFSIVVIYLMIGTTSGMNPEDVAKDIQLPVASATELAETGLLVMVTPKGILINQQQIAREDLAEFLQKMQAELKMNDEERSKRLIIQADKDADFADLNPIVLAGTQSGFETIMFAALQVEEGR